MCKLEVGAFTAEKNKDGTWLYKAKEDQPILKPKPIYKDKPQFPVIGKMEDEFKAQGKQMLEKSIDQILRKIIS